MENTSGKDIVRIGLFLSVLSVIVPVIVIAACLGSGRLSIFDVTGLGTLRWLCTAALLAATLFMSGRHALHCFGLYRKARRSGSIEDRDSEIYESGFHATKGVINCLVAFLILILVDNVMIHIVAANGVVL